MTPQEIDSLVGKAISGDLEAFGQLYSLYYRETVEILRNRYRLPHADAEDIVQKSFLKAQSKISAFEQKSSFRTWLYSIVNNMAIDHLRSSQRREIPILTILNDDGEEYTFDAPDSVSPGADAILSESDKIEQIKAKISQAKKSLTESQRKIFDLVFVEEKSYEDVAKILDCPVGTVMSRVFYTRRKLARRLQNCIS